MERYHPVGPNVKIRVMRGRPRGQADMVVLRYDWDPEQTTKPKSSGAVGDDSVEIIEFYPEHFPQIEAAVNQIREKLAYTPTDEEKKRWKTAPRGSIHVFSCSCEAKKTVLHADRYDEGVYTKVCSSHGACLAVGEEV
jgi:hypothetical protein